VKEFFAYVSKVSGIEGPIVLDGTHLDNGVILKFDNHDTLRPRYLGRSKCQGDFHVMSGSIPSIGDIKEDPDYDDKSLRAFKKKMELAVDAQKNRTRAMKARKQEEQVLKKQRYRWDLKRAQRYLGLRASSNALGEKCSPNIDASGSAKDSFRDDKGSVVDNMVIVAETLALVEQDPNIDAITLNPEIIAAKLADARAEAQSEPQGLSAQELSDLGLAVKVPVELFEPESGVVFVCVDVEAHERTHDTTEVGISTLDTNDIKGIDPGDNGENWRRYINTRHFRIKEFAHLVNKDFVEGCPDKFQFGESEFINQKDVVQAIASCFRLEPKEQAREQDRSSYSSKSSSRPVPDGLQSKNTTTLRTREDTRNLVLLGHDTQSDIRYLRQLGYDPFNCLGLLDVLDTAVMFRVLSREVNPRSLGHLLNDLDIAGWHLHNAGNDAHYTVQAMIGIAVKALRPEYLSNLENARQSRIDTKVSDAKEMAKADEEGWSSDGSDGGKAHLVRPSFAEASSSGVTRGRGFRGNGRGSSGFVGGGIDGWGRGRGSHVEDNGLWIPYNASQRGTGYQRGAFIPAPRRGGPWRGRGE
jgi:hypothetical protein